MTELFEECKLELEEFKDEAIDIMCEDIDAYTADAEKQEHKAKADFLRLIESSIVKLHDLTNLTGVEKVALKDAIVD